MAEMQLNLKSWWTRCGQILKFFPRTDASLETKMSMLAVNTTLKCLLQWHLYFFGCCAICYKQKFKHNLPRLAERLYGKFVRKCSFGNIFSIISKCLWNGILRRPTFVWRFRMLYRQQKVQFNLNARVRDGA